MARKMRFTTPVDPEPPVLGGLSFIEKVWSPDPFWRSLYQVGPVSCAAKLAGLTVWVAEAAIRHDSHFQAFHFGGLGL